MFSFCFQQISSSVLLEYNPSSICSLGISQNHRMVGFGRDLCGSSSPILLPKQGHLQQAAQELVQAGLEYLQRRRLHNLPGQPVPVLCHPQSEEVLPHVHMQLPVLQFVAIAPCLNLPSFSLKPLLLVLSQQPLLKRFFPLFPMGHL